MQPPISERRTSRRLPMQFPVIISRGSTGIEAHGITRDVSQQGVFFYTDSPVAMGQVIEFKMLMPHAGTISRALCNGTVVRVEGGSRAAFQPHGVAVQITSIRLV